MAATNGHSDLERGLLAGGSDGDETPSPNINQPELSHLSTFYSESRDALTRRASSIVRDGIDETLGIAVAVESLNYFVGKHDKHVLKDVSVKFTPGQLSCVMGPSGSGKTTLLSCILGNASGKITSGRILVNEEEGPPRHFKSVAKLIPQEDVLLPSFTVRETLTFHAELVLPTGTTVQEREARVQTVIKSLGLAECADTKVGSVEERGISGGQRKRTSIGIELLSNPCVLCCDEMTSGLDSASAEVVVQILADLAHVAGKRTVICTIHQPSFRIFSLFQHVTLMTRGRVAFSGKMSALEPFFNGLGKRYEAKENPIDVYMRYLQDDDLATSIPDAFAAQRETAPATPALAQSHLKRMDLSAIPLYPTSRWNQFSVLYRRTTLDAIKDPQKFARMLGIKAGVGILVGTVWFNKANPPRQSELFAVQGALFMLVMNGIVETLALTILSFPLVRSLLLREYKNGSYSLLSWYCAMMTSQACFSVLYVVVTAIPVWFMVGFEHDPVKLGIFMLGLVLTTLIGSALGVAVGAASKDLIESQNMLAPVLAPLMLFSGYVIPRAQLPSWAVPFYYISFFQYGIGLFELNVFKDMVFTDYNMDLRHPTHIRPLHTGRQVLVQMGLDPDTHHISTYLYVLTGYAVLLTILGFFIVRRAVERRTA